MQGGADRQAQDGFAVRQANPIAALVSLIRGDKHSRRAVPFALPDETGEEVFAVVGGFGPFQVVSGFNGDELVLGRAHGAFDSVGVWEPSLAEQGGVASADDGGGGGFGVWQQRPHQRAAQDFRAEHCLLGGGKVCGDFPPVFFQQVRFFRVVLAQGGEGVFCEAVKLALSLQGVACGAHGGAVEGGVAAAAGFGKEMVDGGGESEGFAAVNAQFVLLAFEFRQFARALFLVEGFFRRTRALRGGHRGNVKGGALHADVDNRGFFGVGVSGAFQHSDHPAANDIHLLAQGGRGVVRLKDGFAMHVVPALAPFVAALFGRGFQELDFFRHAFAAQSADAAGSGPLRDGAELVGLGLRFVVPLGSLFAAGKAGEKGLPLRGVQYSALQVGALFQVGDFVGGQVAQGFAAGVCDEHLPRLHFKKQGADFSALGQVVSASGSVRLSGGAFSGAAVVKALLSVLADDDGAGAGFPLSPLGGVGAGGVLGFGFGEEFFQVGEHFVAVSVGVRGVDFAAIEGVASVFQSKPDHQVVADGDDFALGQFAAVCVAQALVQPADDVFALAAQVLADVFGAGLQFGVVRVFTRVGFGLREFAQAGLRQPDKGQQFFRRPFPFVEDGGGALPLGDAAGVGGLRFAPAALGRGGHRNEHPDGDALFQKVVGFADDGVGLRGLSLAADDEEFLQLRPVPSAPMGEGVQAVADFLFAFGGLDAGGDVHFGEEGA